MTLYRGIGTTDTTGAVGATQSEEVQTATASQTVFTLTTISFQPGEGNLVIYINGVRQETSAYTEGADGVTVTFSAGLEVGDTVAFVSGEILSSIAGSNATNIAYNPLGGSSTTVHEELADLRVYTPTGGTATTIAAKLGETVSVKDFGAVGDGSTDDTDAIREAIAGGGTIKFPDGDYLCDTRNLTAASGVYFNPYMFDISEDNTSIIGTRGARIIVTASEGASADLFVITAENNITIEGITAEGVPYDITEAGDAETTGGMWYGISLVTNAVEDYDNIKLINNNFKYCLRGGINQINSTLANSIIAGNTLSYIRGHAIAIKDANYVRVTNNHIYKQQTHRQNPYVSGPTFQGVGIDISDLCNNIICTGNIIVDCVYGMKTENDTTIAAQDASGNKIVGNTILGVNINEFYNDSTSAYGIKIGGKRTIASNNHIEACYGTGINIGTGDADQLVITGNSIFGSMNYCIQVDEQDNSSVLVERDKVVISDNSIYGLISGETAPTGILVSGPYTTISNNAIEGVTLGIHLNLSANNVSILGNRIRNSLGNAIYATSADTSDFSVSNNLISSNSIEMDGDNDRGIFLLRSDRTQVINNRIVSTTTTGSNAGIYVNTSANDQGGYAISGNYLANWYRNILCNVADDVQIVSNNILGHGTSDRGINTATITSGLVCSNFVKGCAEGITAQADGASLLIDSNNTAGCTTGITSTSSTIGTNV